MRNQSENSLHFIMKRKFVSHIQCDKVKKVKNNVEDLVKTCYLNVFKEMVETKAVKECNGCVCSYEERVELFYKPCVVELMSCNDAVIERFNDSIKSDVKYPPNDVLNAQNMLKCSIHRENFVQLNYVYFKEELLLFKH